MVRFWHDDIQFWKIAGEAPPVAGKKRRAERRRMPADEKIRKDCFARAADIQGQQPRHRHTEVGLVALQR